MTLCRSTARLNGLANQCAAAKYGYGAVAMVVLGNLAPTYCRGHQLFAGTPIQGSPIPGARGMANICTWVRTGYVGGGFKGNGKPLHNPRDAQPSSSIKDTSCAVSGFHGFRWLPSLQVEIVTETVVGRICKNGIGQVAVRFIAKKSVVPEHIADDPIPAWF